MFCAVKYVLRHDIVIDPIYVSDLILLWPGLTFPLGGAPSLCKYKAGRTNGRKKNLYKLLRRSNLFCSSACSSFASCYQIHLAVNFLFQHSFNLKLKSSSLLLKREKNGVHLCVVIKIERRARTNAKYTKRKIYQMK